MPEFLSYTTLFWVLLLGLVLSLQWYFLRRRYKSLLDRKTERIQSSAKRALTRSETQKNELSSEKDKAIALMRSILPLEVAEELINNHGVTPKAHRRVTVMFTDFINFTRISESMRPSKLVSELDFYFTQFDEILGRYNIEKIKTIGDAYMCAGGLPISNNSNPIDVVLAAFEIKQYMENLKKERELEGLPFWDIRIGVHTGELTAGVVGKHRLAYDIWGDTVNIAHRMESSSEAGQINISGTTHTFVKEFFDCSYRGKIKAKHKGLVDMYYVDSIKIKLSKFGKGAYPNHIFFEELSTKYNSFINYKKMEVYILQRLEQGLSKDLHYHNVQHTRDVHDAVERIAHAERINNEDLLLLKTAALYHDSGFLSTYISNEPIGAALAVDTLGNFGYNQEQINVIADLIMSTQIPQKPNNYLQEIICDADLDYLGRADFFEIGDRLKKELMVHNMIASDRQWDEVQIRFLEKHKYFTTTSQNTRESTKQKHLQMVIERYEANKYPVAE